MDIGVEVPHGRSGELLATAGEFPRPTLDVATWSPQRHPVSCARGLKLRADAGQNFRATESRLGPELFRPAIANVGTCAVCMLQGRAMWSIESCLFLLIPVTRLPKPGVLHSTPLSLVVSRCSQHIPCRNSSSVLVSCAPLECYYAPRNAQQVYCRRASCSRES